jgi:hypothetical protein
MSERFSISQLRKILILLALIFLIFNQIIITQEFLLNPNGYSYLIKIVLSSILILSDFYILINLLNYYKYYSLNNIYSTTLVLLFISISFGILKTLSFLNDYIPESLISILEVSILIVEIIIMIKTLRVNSSLNDSIIHLKKYSKISLILYPIIVILILVVKMSDRYEKYEMIPLVLIVIPYLQMIKFWNLVPTKRTIANTV